MPTLVSTSWELMIYKYLVLNKDNFKFSPVIKKLSGGELILEFEGLTPDISFHLNEEASKEQFEFHFNGELFDIDFSYGVYEKNDGRNWWCTMCEDDVFYPSRESLWFSHLDAVKSRVNFIKHSDILMYISMDAGGFWHEVMGIEKVAGYLERVLSGDSNMQVLKMSPVAIALEGNSL